MLRKIAGWAGLSAMRTDTCYPKSLFLLTGAVVGVGGVMLSFLGNPPNTGFCVSCFMENIAGSIGLHGNIRMQYLRPEIIGFVIGSLLMSVHKREFRATGGSSPLLRYFVGILLIVGCAVFMGCPIKMVLRISAGDLTALIGVAGLSAGVFIGMKFLENGFSLGRPNDLPAANALLMPGLMAALLAALLWKPVFISLSTKGAGAEYAPLYISLLAGLVVGSLAQRTGFCITGGLARLFLWGPREIGVCPKSSGLLVSIGSFFLFALVASLLTGQFSLGWHGQPSSNESHLWNFLGMVMVGFGSVLIKGCPFRQLIAAGQGDTDAGAAVLGMLTGAALVQDWGLGGNAAGTPYEGKLAVLFGICALFIIGLLYRRRGETFAPEFQTGLD
ncbi:MAG TPA: YedE family putative selenium transporter [Thermodesulfovibrionales bacterium]|nr:YedE family putative selenium transporter [Thermodesulfovibrionales bacterium]